MLGKLELTRRRDLDLSGASLERVKISIGLVETREVAGKVFGQVDEVAVGLGLEDSLHLRHDFHVAEAKDGVVVMPVEGSEAGGVQPPL